MRPPAARGRPGTPITRSPSGRHAALLCRPPPAGARQTHLQAPHSTFVPRIGNHTGAVSKIDPGPSCALLGGSWGLPHAPGALPSVPVVATGRHGAPLVAAERSCGRRPRPPPMLLLKRFCNKVVATVARALLGAPGRRRECVAPAPH